MNLNEEIPLDTNYALVPAAPDGWERTAATAVPADGNTNEEKGWYGAYTRTILGLQADLFIYSDTDTDTVEIELVERHANDPESLTKLLERTVPEIEDVETLNEIATEWVEKTESDEF